MDAKRFDTIAKALISETNRRRTLGGLLGGAFAALGLSGADETDAAKSGKCKTGVWTLRVLQAGEMPEDRKWEEGL